MYASRYAGQFPRMNDESLNLKGSLIGNDSSSGRQSKFDMTSYMPKGMNMKDVDSDLNKNKLPVLKGMGGNNNLNDSSSRNNNDDQSMLNDDYISTPRNKQGSKYKNI